MGRKVNVVWKLRIVRPLICMAVRSGRFGTA